MIKVAISIVVFVLVAAYADPGAQTAKRGRAQRNRAPTIQSFTSSLSEIDYCPFAPDGLCSSRGTSVTLKVEASDPDSDRLTYSYSVTAGSILGTGETVTWNLFKSPLKMQTATVEVADERGGKASSSVQVSVVLCGVCDLPCPTLSVSCPSEAKQGDEALFVATIFVDADTKPIYLWSHSHGKRLAGQEGPELRIKALGRAGEVITGTVRVLGIDPACSREASCQSRIVK